jgi:hypothetical protein
MVFIFFGMKKQQMFANWHKVFHWQNKIYINKHIDTEVIMKGGKIKGWKSFIS